MAYGRRRAAARLAGAGYAPHPGWRHFIAEGWRVLTDQAEALRVVEDLVAAEDWRSDKRVAWTAILRRLVYSMDWDTGLIAAVTAERLGEAGDRAPRTVSRVIAWARDAGLLVVVELAASAEFLGTEHGRTPTYAPVTSTPLSQQPQPSGTPDDSSASAQVSLPVTDIGDLPEKLDLRTKPLNGRRLEPVHTPTPGWPAYRIPQSPADRNCAAQCLFRRLGLDGAGVSGVPLWRARALLKTWWDDGACPAALVWAIDHHPDNPVHHRGDALRGVRDPLRVLGARLKPWQGRLGELPAHLVGYRGEHPDTGRPTSTPPAAPEPPQAASSESVRAAARAAVAEHLAELRRRRGRPNRGT